MTRENRDAAFSPFVLDRAESFNAMKGRRGNLGAPFVKAVAGSNYPGYIQMPWKKQKHLSPDDYNDRQWITWHGDLTAGRLPKNWHKAVIVACYDWALDDLRPSDQEAHEAVAYEADGRIRVASIPDTTIFHELGGQQDHLRGIALRLGRGTLKASLGYWLPEEKELLLPWKVLRSVDSPLEIDSQLKKQYPGMVLG